MLALPCILALTPSCKPFEMVDSFLGACGALPFTGTTVTTKSEVEQLSASTLGYRGHVCSSEFDLSYAYYVAVNCSTGVKTDTTDFGQDSAYGDFTGFDRFLATHRVDLAKESPVLFFEHAEALGFAAGYSRLYEGDEEWVGICGTRLPEVERNWFAVDDDVLARRQEAMDNLKDVLERVYSSSSADEGGNE